MQLGNDTLEWRGQARVEQRAQTVQLGAGGDLQLEGLTLGEPQQRTPHTSLARLALQQLRVESLQDIQVAELRLSGLRTALHVDSTGLAPYTTHRGTAATAAAAPSRDDGEAALPRLRIGAILLEGDNRIEFEDRTVSPAFRQSLSPERLSVGASDSQAPEQATPFSLDAALGEHSRLSLTGTLKPYARPPALSLEAGLQDYEMPPLSPYAVRQLGYKINSGQLESSLTLDIADNAMQGEAKLKARQLAMEAEDPARIEQFEQQSSMPLSTALNLLRDKENNISLTVPLSGNLDDPQFDFSDAINTALANTLRSASVSYLKYLLQPYGSLITLAQLAGKAGGSIQLEAVNFTPGSVEPEAVINEYLERLAALFAQRKGLQLRLCGTATTADLLALSGGALNAIPPEGHQQLETLARERAEQIKRMLVEQHGVAPGQLFVCHPALDRKEGGVPRVELQL
jgi:hypothetical protein